MAIKEKYHGQAKIKNNKLKRKEQKIMKKIILISILTVAVILPLSTHMLKNQDPETEIDYAQMDTYESDGTTSSRKPTPTESNLYDSSQPLVGIWIEQGSEDNGYFFYKDGLGGQLGTRNRCSWTVRNHRIYFDWGTDFWWFLYELSDDNNTLTIYFDDKGTPIPEVFYRSDNEDLISDN